MEIFHSQHFIKRNELRGIDPDIAEHVFFEADRHYYDEQTGMCVAVKHILFKNRLRDISLVYKKEKDDGITFVTIHPLKEGQKTNRIITGRWKPL